MADELRSGPFGTEDLPRIHLERAPLARVVAQLRYPNLAALRGDLVANEFASRFGKEYPVLQDQRGVNLLVTPTGLSQQPTDERIWSFRSGDEKWKLTLGTNFLALDTADYPKRKEFIDRFLRAVNALMELANPPYFERLGLRYINRIEDLNLINGRLRGMIRSEMQGALATERPSGVEIRHALFDSLFIDGERAIQMRSGILPPRATMFGLEVPVVDEISWVLDIDSYIEQKMTLNSADTSQSIHNLADRAYRMFRWVVNEQFIGYFGGEQ